ncbi:MAG: hypothetical protein A3H28_08020 [Acidobacteria bacterium RIFCSPLOWO2_02_FULL_61_28]|nr:MAG: hypothetical protein A3H28_08020 [Acidobacteria bacterium RIFCSPLOWO2_02_FULL_61_28]
MSVKAAAGPGNVGGDPSLKLLPLLGRDEIGQQAESARGAAFQTVFRDVRRDWGGAGAEEVAEEVHRKNEPQRTQRFAEKKSEPRASGSHGMIFMPWALIRQRTRNEPTVRLRSRP